MRTSLGVLLAALAAGGCSLALDMDRFGRGGDEKVVAADTNETRSSNVDDPNVSKTDGGAEAGQPSTTGDGAKDNGSDAGGPALPPPSCTMQEVEPNGSEPSAQEIGLGTLCAALTNDKDVDWFEYASAGATTLTIEGAPTVTATVYRNGTAIVTHSGSGRSNYGVPSGFIQIWVHGVGAGVMGYRITLK